MNSVKQYFQGVQAEWQHIDWPNRNQVFWYTLVVVIMSLLIAYGIGLADMVFNQLLALLVN